MINEMRNRYVAGADIGGTNIKLVLLNSSGEVVARSRIETEVQKGPLHAIEKMCNAVKSLLATRSLSLDALGALGVGAAGPLDITRGVVVQAPNLPGWEEIPLVDVLRESLEIEVFLDNDANMAAFGESRLGAGRGIDNLICFTLGTGVGGGIILNGEIYRGASGAGAELGHMTIDLEGSPCKCGNRGCLETMASAPAVAKKAVEAMKAGKGKVIYELVGGDAEKVGAEVVHRAALKGDVDAVDILAKAGRALGVGITNVVNIFAPQMVVLGGGLMKAGDFILEPAREEVSRRAFKAFTERLSIVPALLGDSSGAIGAACYAMHSMEGW